MGSLAEWIEKRWRGFSPAVRAAFLAAFLVGLIGHASFLTNHFYNHDSISYLLQSEDSTFALQQGKWLSLPVSLFFGGKVVTPGAILVAGILLISVSAALTTSILEIHSPLWGALVGALMVLFPSVMSTNTYEGAAVFFTALFLAALSVYVTLRFRRWGHWLGIVLLTLSCGTYAAYIGYAAGLFVLVALLRLLDGKTPVRRILLDGLKYLAVLAVSAILYYLILKIALRLHQVSLAGYRGINNIGNFSFASILASTVESYRKVYYFFRYGIFIYRVSFRIETTFLVLNWATMLLCVILSVWSALRNRVYRSAGRIALILALVLLFPLAIHAIGVLGQNANTHWAMVYPFVLVYVYLLVCADRTEQFPILEGQPDRRVRAGKRSALAGTLAVLAVSLILCRQWYLTTNQGYEFLRYANENAYASGVLLVDDMRETPDYQEGQTPVAFVGDGAPIVFRYTTGDFSAIASPDGSRYTGLCLPVVDCAHLKSLMRNWIGIELVYVTDEEAATLASMPEVKAMPVYPAAGAIAIIDGCLVVKLSTLAG